MVLIAHVSSDPSNAAETASILEFAQRARKMQVKVRRALPLLLRKDAPFPDSDLVCAFALS